jgi:hypothetical protein
MIKKINTKMLVLALMFVFATTYIFADEPVKGSITSQGTVMVNGSAILSGSTLGSPSRVSSMENSNAVINLGSIGQVFVDAKTEFNINFTEAGIQINLMSGALRVQKANPNSNVQVTTDNCSQIEVMDGEISVLQKGKNSSPESLLNTGQMKEWKNKSAVFSTSRSNSLDYKVSIIDCDNFVAKSPKNTKAIAIVAGAAGGATAAILPFLGSDESGTTVSNSRP